mgnify:CR=1 FL=1
MNILPSEASAEAAATARTPHLVAPGKRQGGIELSCRDGAAAIGAGEGAACQAPGEPLRLCTHLLHHGAAPAAEDLAAEENGVAPSPCPIAARGNSPSYA